MSEIPAQEVRWLWPQRLPAAKLGLIVGVPCTGKTFVALDVLARLSRGSGWPDDPSVAGSVENSLIISGEDGASDTLVPRLAAMGADLTRIRYVFGAKQDPKAETLPVSLETDLRALEDTIAATQSKIVLLDPLSAFLGKRDSHRDAEIRGLLTPRAHMAERTGAMILGIVHLNKARGVSAVERIMGSVAFGAAARSVYLIARDEADDRRRIFATVKNNLAKEKPPGLTFTLEDGCVLWGAEPVDVDADTLVNPDFGDRSERGEVIEWLRGLLKDGAVPHNEIKRAAEAEAISLGTLKRAKKALRVRSEREGYGRDGRFMWALPEAATEEAHTGAPSSCAPMAERVKNAVSSIGAQAVGDPNRTPLCPESGSEGASGKAADPDEAAERAAIESIEAEQEGKPR